MQVKGNLIVSLPRTPKSKNFTTTQCELHREDKGELHKEGRGDLHRKGRGELHDCKG